MLEDYSEKSVFKNSHNQINDIFERKLKSDFDSYMGGIKKTEKDQNQEDTPRMLFTRLDKNKGKYTNHKDYDDIDRHTIFIN